MEENRQVPESVENIAKKLDVPINAKVGYGLNPTQEFLRTLYATGSVEVGWRESCGTTDPTMLNYRAWRRVLKALEKEGCILTEERQSHKNGWATKSGGFWNSIVYRLPTPAEGQD